MFKNIERETQVVLKITFMSKFKSLSIHLYHVTIIRDYNVSTLYTLINTSYRSNGERLLKCQLNSSYLIDSLILVTKIFYEA